MSEEPDQRATADEEMLWELRLIRRLMIGVLLILGLTATYFARTVLLPIVMAVLIALVLRPPARALERIGLPAPVSGGLIIMVLVMIMGYAAWILSGPVNSLVERAPEIQADVRWKLRDVIEQMSAMQDLGDGVAEIATGEAAPQQVVVDNSGLLPAAMSSIGAAGSSLVAAVVLSLFLLGSGDMFLRRTIEVAPRLADKKRALTIARTAEQQVSRYLSAVTLINAGLGVAVGLAVWALGMPMPLVWGVAAFLLNFVPFAGAVVGVICMGAVSLVTFDDIGPALLPPLAYLILTSIEGQFVTPALLGRHLELNSVVVFVTVVFWIWLWGVPGAVLAVPFLVVLRVVAENIEGWRPLARFLAAGD